MRESRGHSPTSISTACEDLVRKSKGVWTELQTTPISSCRLPTHQLSKPNTRSSSLRQSLRFRLDSFRAYIFRSPRDKLVPDISTH